MLRCVLGFCFRPSLISSASSVYSIEVGCPLGASSVAFPDFSISCQIKGLSPAQCRMLVRKPLRIRQPQNQLPAHANQGFLYPSKPAILSRRPGPHPFSHTFLFCCTSEHPCHIFSIQLFFDQNLGWWVAGSHPLTFFSLCDESAALIL